MTYPFHIQSGALLDWERQFIAACDEQAWLPAAQLLRAHMAARPGLIAPGAFAPAVVRFVQEAPECALLRCGLPNTTQTGVDRWRAHLLGHLLGGHLTRGRHAGLHSDFGRAHHHLGSAITMRARTDAQEVATFAVLTELANLLAKVEEPVAASRPDLADEPTLVSPHPGGLAQPNGYHPAFMGDLAFHAVRAGASAAFMELVVRLCFTALFWPTWRALGEVPDREKSVLREAGTVVLGSGIALAPGAAVYLAHFVGGGAFRYEAPERAADDVDF